MLKTEVKGLGYINTYKDTNSITDLIKQVIKINNKIFQKKRTNKGNNNKTIPIYKAP